MMKETYREDDNQLDGVSEQPGELLAEAMEALGFGIMLVAKDGFITFANAVARELMQRGDGLLANGGWIAATSVEATTRLRACIKSSAVTPQDGHRGGRTIIMERGPGRSSLFVHVLALDRNGRRAKRSAAAMVFIVDPDTQAAPSFNAFAVLYGLTCAETRVLREIVGGHGLLAAAVRLGLSEATARTHLQHIFEKTGAKRQTELLCLFFKATLPGQIGED
jgi:DNA-binding CsgD family transcriptional regulator